MNRAYEWWEKLGIFMIAAFTGAFGFAAGYDSGTNITTKKLSHEAVREKAGQWVAGEDGSPSFKWSVCVPAKPQEMKTK